MCDSHSFSFPFSAGVGHTVTFITIDHVMEQVKKETQKTQPNSGPFQVSITDQQVLADYTICNLTVPVLGMSCEYV